MIKNVACAGEEESTAALSTERSEIQSEYPDLQRQITFAIWHGRSF